MWGVSAAINGLLSGSFSGKMLVYLYISAYISRMVLINGEIQDGNDINMVHLKLVWCSEMFCA